MSTRQKLQETIANTAFYYGRQVTPAVIIMMTEDLSAYEPEDVIAAYERYRKNPKNRQFPLPAQIIEILDGGSAKASASAVVVNLIAAVKRHDYTWPSQLNKSAYQTGSFEGDFRAELGDAAWEVVQMHGGWPRFCASYWNNHGNETAFKAQLKALVEDVMEGRRAGDLLPFQRRNALPPVEERRGPNDQQIALLKAEAEEKGDHALSAEIDRLVSIVKKEGT